MVALAVREFAFYGLRSSAPAAASVAELGSRVAAVERLSWILVRVALVAACVAARAAWSAARQGLTLTSINALTWCVVASTGFVVYVTVMTWRSYAREVRGGGYLIAADSAPPPDMVVDAALGRTFFPVVVPVGVALAATSLAAYTWFVSVSGDSVDRSRPGS